MNGVINIVNGYGADAGHAVLPLQEKAGTCSPRNHLLEIGIRENDHG